MAGSSAGDGALHRELEGHGRVERVNLHLTWLPHVDEGEEAFLPCFLHRLT